MHPNTPSCPEPNAHDAVSPQAQPTSTVRFLETILNTLPEPVFVKDEQHRWVFLNDAFGQFMGARPEDLLGKSDYDFFPAHEADVFWAMDEEVLRTGRENVNEEIFTSASGKQSVVVTKKSLYCGEDGQKLIVGVIHDVTEQKVAEEALRESENRFRGLVDVTFDGIMIHENGRILEANQALADMAGSPLEALLGTSVFDMADPKDHPVVLERIRDGGEQRYVIEGVRHDGSRFPLEIVGRAGTYQGRPVRIAAFRDISRYKRLENELRRQNERLKELDQLKSNFVGSVSHELRTPLTAIKGFTEFLEEAIAGPLNDRQLDFVQRIMESTTRLERLVDDLLDFARLESGAFKLVLLEEDLSRKVGEIAQAFKPQARERQVRLETVLAQPSLLMRMDAGRIGQVLANMIGNALKFTPEGGLITVSLEVRPNAVRVAVRDTGEGIAADHLSHLFERFYQVDAGTTRKTGGTGLGLSISKALVEAHGGTMGVDSEPGNGSTFWFSLPLTPADH